jgi:hypothetical protein
MAVGLLADEHNNFSLPAEVSLRSVPSDRLSRHGDLGLRHPLAIYNTSIATVAQRFDHALRALSAIVPTAGPATDAQVSAADKLLESQEALLHGLMHHMEDCLAILKGFARDDAAFKKHASAKKYGQAVREYRSHIGIVVNRIKHQTGRLRLLIVRLGASSFCGYFVERGLAGGAVGPDPDIHKGGDTAFSFNRDLRYHMCHVICTSEQLARAVEALTSIPHIEGGPTAQPLVNAAVNVASLAETYFPDEYEKPRPVLRFDGSVDDVHRLTAGFESSAGWRPFAGHTFHVNLLFRGDGATRSWKVPYGRLNSA